METVAAAISPAVLTCIGLPLVSLSPAPPYTVAVYAAPDDLGTLNAYSTYSARLAKVGVTMVRFGVDVQAWTVEVVFVIWD